MMKTGFILSMWNIHFKNELIEHHVFASYLCSRVINEITLDSIKLKAYTYDTFLAMGSLF